MYFAAAHVVRHAGSLSRLVMLTLISGACSGQIGGGKTSAGTGSGGSMIAPQGGAGGSAGSGNTGGSGVTGGSGGDRRRPRARREPVGAALAADAADPRAVHPRRLRPAGLRRAVAGHASPMSAAASSRAGVSLTALQVEERLTTAEAIAAAAAPPATRLAGAAALRSRGTWTTACAGQRSWRASGSARSGGRWTPAPRPQLRKLFDAGQGRGRGGRRRWSGWWPACCRRRTSCTSWRPRPAGAAGTVVPLAPARAGQPAVVLPVGLAARRRSAGGRGEGRSAPRPEGMTAQVDRMLRDPRALAGARTTTAHLLKLDELEDISREAPEFTPALAAELRRSALTGIAELYQSRAKHRGPAGSDAVRQRAEAVYG